MTRKERNDIRKAKILKARELYASDELEIDDSAQMSEPGDDGDKGVWIQAWVWVPDEENKEGEK